MKTTETLYNTYVNVQTNNLESVAIYTREGDIVTHRRFLSEIDKIAGWLFNRNINNLKIGILSSSSYEEGVFLLAASKSGAVSKFIDFTKNITEIAESIEESSVEVLVMGAEFIPMEQFINPKKVPVIVLGDIPNKAPHHHLYKDILKESVCDCTPAQYVEGKGTVIINSSGTTGTPKPIELSDRAINAAVLKMANTDYPLEKGNILLKTIPSHIGMGLITSLYTCLIVGVPMMYLGGNSPQESMRLFIGAINGFHNFLKEKQLPLNCKLLVFGAPLYFRSLFQMVEHINDLSFVGCMLAGGSAMGKEELEMMDAAFASKGCTVPVVNGYGQNEMAGAVALNRNEMNRRGSAGIPVSGTELLIVDIENGKPVERNTVGKILERSESLFVQYENMPEQTKESFILIDGKEWFDTKDIGYIDDDGFLFITGRTSRVIIRFDVKVLLDKIESKIRMSQYVKEAGVVSVKGGVYETPVAFITLNEEYKNTDVTPERIIDEIQQGINPLTEPEMVDVIYIVDSLPYRSSGKVDYRALEQQAETK